MTNKVLFDKVISEMQIGLKSTLPWLNVAYGKAQKIATPRNGSNDYLPAVYKEQGNDYTSLLPDSTIGNFCFFLLNDPQTLEWQSNQQGYLTTPFALIFWLDLRTILDSTDNRDTDYIKAQILRELNGGFRLTSGTIKIDEIYEEAENIYQEFSLEEVDNQYLIHPFKGFRFEGTIRAKEPCL